MSEEFVKVASKVEIQPSCMKKVRISDEDICIANVEGKFYAIGNVCSHQGGPLANGNLKGFEVECPWHGSKFDLRTGEVIKPPAVRPVPTYEVKTDDSNVLIRIPMSKK